MSVWTVSLTPDVYQLAAMRECRRNYSLPTLHEGGAPENEMEKAHVDTPELVDLPEHPEPAPPLSYEEIRYFDNTAGSRAGLIGRRHTFTAKSSRREFDGRIRSYTYDVEVSLLIGQPSSSKLCLYVSNCFDMQAPNFYIVYLFLTFLLH